MTILIDIISFAAIFTIFTALIVISYLANFIKSTRTAIFMTIVIALISLPISNLLTNKFDYLIHRQEHLNSKKLTYRFLSARVWELLLSYEAIKDITQKDEFLYNKNINRLLLLKRFQLPNSKELHYIFYTTIDEKGTLFNRTTVFNIQNYQKLNTLFFNDKYFSENEYKSINDLLTLCKTLNYTYQQLWASFPEGDPYRHYTEYSDSFIDNDRVASCTKLIDSIVTQTNNLIIYMNRFNTSYGNVIRMYKKIDLHITCIYNSKQNEINKKSKLITSN